MSTHAPTREHTGLLTPADVARFANVSKATVYRLVDRGELQAIHVGRQLRIDPMVLDAYLAAGSRG